MDDSFRLEHFFLTLDPCVYNAMNPRIDSELTPLVTGMCKVERSREKHPSSD